MTLGVGQGNLIDGDQVDGVGWGKDLSKVGAQDIFFDGCMPMLTGDSGFLSGHSKSSILYIIVSVPTFSSKKSEELRNFRTHHRQ